MSENDIEKFISDGEKSAVAEVKEFALEDFKINSISSAEAVAPRSSVKAVENFEFKNAENDSPEIFARANVADITISRKMESPVFRALSEPTLPDLQRENRARLQMQSPTRLHFYWSFKTNPFDALLRIFGAQTAKNYTLVVRLVNETNDRAEIVPVQTEGSWWFDADANAAYRAEIGFYAANRPFVRLLFSNRIETPRKNPSARAAATAEWTIAANDFAEVLDRSGFAQDAFEVALAGDDFSFAENATKTAFTQMFGETDNDFANDNSSEMRFALLALAAGYAPENLRGQISHSLFVRLQSNVENLSAEKALAVLQENFGAVAVETAETEQLLPTVFGASLINFPRASKRRFSPKFAPLSSFSSLR